MATYVTGPYLLPLANLAPGCLRARKALVVLLAVVSWPITATGSPQQYDVNLFGNDPITGHLLSVIGTITLDPDTDLITGSSLFFRHQSDPLTPLLGPFPSTPIPEFDWVDDGTSLFITRTTSNLSTIQWIHEPSQPPNTLTFGSGPIPHNLGYAITPSDEVILKPPTGPDGPNGFLVGVRSESSGATLINNGSFENVPGSEAGQGILPSDWLQLGNISPGADTYSNDGSYGITPGSFGNFDSVAASDGIRWVAGGIADDRIESFGQILSATLTPGVQYHLSGWLHQSLARDNPGSYKVLLAEDEALNGSIEVGSFAPTVSVAEGWVSRSFSFTAPENSDSLSVIAFEPMSDVLNAYPGLDDVSLVPEPCSLVLVLAPIGSWGMLRHNRARRRLRG